MTIRLTKIQVILIAIVFVFVVILLSVIFTSRHYQKDESEAFKNIIEAKDSTISAIQREREVLTYYYDTLISMKKDEADVYIKKTVSNKQFYKQNQIDYENIPVIVRNLSKDSLRRAINNY